MRFLVPNQEEAYLFRWVPEFLSRTGFVLLCLASALGTVLVSSCEKHSADVLDQDGLPPIIYSPLLTPSIVNTDTINVGLERLSDDRLLIPLTVTVRVSCSASSQISSVAFEFFQDSRFSLLSGFLYDNGLDPDLTDRDSVFSAKISLTFIRSQIGTFYFDLSATDGFGNGSNIIRIPFVLVRLNQSPVLSNLNAPDTLHTITDSMFVATVRVLDPDGLADIRSVTRTTPQGNIYLLNDAGANGDAIAGDGIYSETVSLRPPPPPGSYTFSFQAFDRSSAASNIILHTIVVLQ